MSETLANKTAKNSVWSIIDMVLKQGVGFVISIILARLLTPTDYGTIGIMMIFITLANVFVDSGFGAGLIRKLDRTDKDLDTAFMFNVFIGILAYLVLFLCAPIIATFFENDQLVVLLRFFGLLLIIQSLNVVQNAIMIYKMQVKKLAFISAVSQISTGVIAIFLAYRGWGVWALVAQQLSAQTFICVLLFFNTGWRPHWNFDRRSLAYLWNFGSKLLTATFIGQIFNQIYSFIIGKVLGQRELGLFTRSDQFSMQPNGIITNIINKALVPSLALCQGDVIKMQKNYSKCVEIISLVVFPLMIGLALLSKQIFNLLLGSKWDAAIPIFSILCIAHAFDVFSTLSLQLIQVMGRTDYTLKIEIIKKSIVAIFIFIAINYGLMGLTFCKLASCVLAALVNLSVVKVLLKYSYLKQLFDLFKYAIVTLIIFVPIYLLLKSLWNNNLFLIIVFPISAAVLYFVAVKKLDMPAYMYCKTMLNDLLNSRKNSRKGQQ